ncbi:MAG: prepilin peptidase [Propionibacteriaceae bacterium]|nr:prepilin peptidase [Propionibacteriaceae bacterium]
MNDVGVIAMTSAITGLVVALTVRPVLSRLREPADAGDKIAYRELATPRFVLGCTVLAMAAAVVSQTTLPVQVQPQWMVLATCGVFLAAIDAGTTWLPLRVTYAGWALMALACVVSLAFGAGSRDLLRIILGAAIAWGLYYAIWAVTRGGFGFGDVRFAPVLGAAAASQSWTLLIWGLTLGTVVGAAHGMTRLLRRQRGGFAYAPSMLAGHYLAAIALHFSLGDPKL